MEVRISELSTEKALALSKTLDDISLSPNDSMLLTADMKWVRPFGMLVATNALKNLRHKFPNNTFTMRHNALRDGVSYAAHMGFFRTISKSIMLGNAPGEASGNDNYIPITNLDLQQLHMDNIAAGVYVNIGESIERKSAELAKVLCRSSVEMQQLMTYLLREILRNIPEHAESGSAWLCGQYWSNQTAEIAILDNGIGIRKSLQNNRIHRQYVTDDESALRCAIKAGISQAFDPARGNRNADVWSNSGYGLFMTSEICKKLNGSFCIASGNSYLNIAHDGKISSGSSHVQGTAIKLEFSTKELKNSKEVIREIAGLGEAQAQLIKNAFKKASHPSKGLVLK